MSSSLDDLEPYEIFQQELDELLKEFCSKGNCSDHKDMMVLNNFIEYACFIRSWSHINEIEEIHITTEFPAYMNAIYPNMFSAKEVADKVGEFVKWIKLRHNQ